MISYENRANSPDGDSARYFVMRALKTGTLKKDSVCRICKEAKKLEAHHYKGYAIENRLVVAWLCKQCHGVATRIERICQSKDFQKN